MRTLELILVLSSLTACSSGAMTPPDASSDVAGDSAPEARAGDAGADAVVGYDACADGQRTCSGACTDLQTNVEHCGSCATSCQIPGATAATTCVAGACHYVCASSGTGAHVCTRPGATQPSCVDNASPMTCGARCDPCPTTTANAHPTCDGTACGIECDAHFCLRPQDGGIPLCVPC